VAVACQQTAQDLAVVRVIVNNQNFAHERKRKTIRAASSLRWPSIHGRAGRVEIEKICPQRLRLNVLRTR
jgi:hypothetical protein